jgi:hypothetical protein
LTIEKQDEVLTVSKGAIEAAMGAGFGVAMGVSMYQGMAIVAALAESGVIDQLRVALWAENFAAMQAVGDPPGASDWIASGLKSFAAVIRAMAAPPVEATMAQGTMTRQ